MAEATNVEQRSPLRRANALRLYTPSSDSDRALGVHWSIVSPLELACAIERRISINLGASRQRRKQHVTHESGHISRHHLERQWDRDCWNTVVAVMKPRRSAVLVIPWTRTSSSRRFITYNKQQPVGVPRRGWHWLGRGSLRDILDFDAARRRSDPLTINAYIA